MRARQQQRMEEKKMGILEPGDNAILPAFPSPVKTSTAAPATASRNPFKE